MREEAAEPPGQEHPAARPGLQGVLSELQPLVQESTSTRVASRLRDAIIDGQLAPGTQVTEVPVAARLGVSRGPVREAMQRLIQEGLLRSDWHRGVFVVSLGPAQVRDLYLTREIVETAAAQRLAQAGPTKQAMARLRAALDQFRRATERRSWRGLVAADLRFHSVLVEEGGTLRLSQAFESLSVETRICLNRLKSFYPNRQDLVLEHEAICAALEQGGAEAIASHIHEHMQVSADRLVAAWGEEMGRASGPSRRARPRRSAGIGESRAGGSAARSGGQTR